MSHNNPSKQIKSGSDIGIILLAAGSSSRMGESKQLLKIENEPLLLKSAQTALQSEVEKVVVVLGSNEANNRQIIKHLPIEIITNPDWQTGMGSSLKAGLTSLLQLLPQLGAVLVMVCDQPLLTTDHLNKLLQTFKQTGSPIIASYYSDTTGVPAIFEKSIFKKLLHLENESGAKKILSQYKELVQPVDFPMGAIDLDTPEDYKRFIGKNS